MRDLAMGRQSALQSRLADLYFRPKWFEESGRLFALVGVRMFKRWVVKWGRLAGKAPNAEQDYFIWDRTPRGLREFEAKTRRNELIHLAITVIGVPVVVGAFVRGGPFPGAVLLIVVVATQLFPVMLQRYHRTRLYRVAARMNRRKEPGNRAGRSTVD